MRTYYIKFERQGNTLCIFKIEASSYEEAEVKALKALHETDEIGEISKEAAMKDLESGEIDYILDEDGCEIDPEDDDDYEEIEFFEGDEGDIAAEEYVLENNIDDYEIEWDNYRKGYILYGHVK